MLKLAEGTVLTAGQLRNTSLPEERKSQDASDSSEGIILDSKEFKLQL